MRVDVYTLIQCLSNTHIILAIVGIFLAGFSSIFTG